MRLSLAGGKKVAVGSKSSFEVVEKGELAEIRVYPRGGNTPYHVAWHYGRANALKHLAEIENAIRRGEREFG